MVVGGWRNMGWGSTIRMKTKTLRYLMLKVHDVEYHSLLFCLVPFNSVFQIMQEYGSVARSRDEQTQKEKV